MKELLESKKFTFEDRPYQDFLARGDNIVVNLYTSGKVVIGGSNKTEKEEIENFLKSLGSYLILGFLVSISIVVHLKIKEQHHLLDEGTYRKWLAVLNPLMLIEGNVGILLICIQNIGLTQRLIVTLDDRGSASNLSRILQAQATTLPRARVMSCESLTALILDFPGSASLLAISKVLSELASDTTEMCTFIAEQTPLWHGLGNLIPSSQRRRS